MTGNTGGPHVCYRFWKHGREVDPFKEKLPSAEPLKKSIKPEYFEFIKPLKYQLDNKMLPLKNQKLLRKNSTKLKKMALKNINPTTTNAWKELTNHFNDIKNINIKDLIKKTIEKKIFL